MRLLFEMDTKDYDRNGTAFIRHSARCINIKNGLVAMVHSIKYDYYKFPGGGIEKGESAECAMIRETREEAGLTVVPGTGTFIGFKKAIMTMRTILFRTITTISARLRKAYNLRIWTITRRMKNSHWSMWSPTRQFL